MIKIEPIGLEKVDKVLKDLPKKANQIKYRVVQRAALAGKSEAIKQAKNKYNLKTEEITKTFKLIKPTKDNPISELISTGKRIRLIKFKVTPKAVPKKRKNIKVSVLKAQGMKTLKSAFIAKMPNGITGIFEREGRERVPLRQLFGPSVPQLFRDETIKTAIKEKAKEVLEKRIVHELNRVVGE